MKERPTPCGEEEDWSAYTKPDPDQKHYSEKGDHLQRTLGNDNRKHGHKEHFKKNRR